MPEALLRRPEVPHILTVGGGYPGMHPAYRLQKRLRRGEATVTVVDPAAEHDLPAVPVRNGIAELATCDHQPDYAQSRSLKGDFLP